MATIEIEYVCQASGEIGVYPVTGPTIEDARARARSIVARLIRYRLPHLMVWVSPRALA